MRVPPAPASLSFPWVQLVESVDGPESASGRVCDVNPETPTFFPGIRREEKPRSIDVNPRHPLFFRGYAAKKTTFD